MKKLRIGVVLQAITAESGAKLHVDDAEDGKCAIHLSGSLTQARYRGTNHHGCSFDNSICFELAQDSLQILLVH